MFSKKVVLVSVAISTCVLAAETAAQQISHEDRDLVGYMLKDISGDIKKHYYDPKLRGLDWDSKVTETKQKIDTSPSLNMAMSHLAAALDALNDSHTFFLPPPRPYRHDYGWRSQIIGDHCFVIRVRPGSDAEAKGLKPGDEILKMNGYAPDRSSFWKMEYVYKVLRPQAGLRLDLRDPEGKDRQLEIAAKRIDTKRVADLSGADAGSDMWNIIRDMETEADLMRGRSVELEDDIMVLKIPQFFFTDGEISDMMTKARKHKGLVLDLRGNPGGSTDTLKALVGCLFDKEVKIADRVERDKTQPMLSKTNRHDVYSGKLVVLVDSKSASASELLARVVQLEKRGVVMGDNSSGSVMESRRYSYKVGTDRLTLFGASITDADLIMTDGKSLEHVGIVPDEIAVPTAADLSEGRDPVLARAVSALGGKMSSEVAGRMFPFEWPQQ